MENKINLEELMLRQYNEALASKDRLESKIAAYLAANALILGVLVTFISILYGCKEINEIHSFLLLNMVSFTIGLLNLLISIFILLPRRQWSFSSEKLLRIYFSDNNFDSELLMQNEKIIFKNKRVINLIRTGSHIVSFGLMLQILVFTIVSLEFFKILLGD